MKLLRNIFKSARRIQSEKDAESKRKRLIIEDAKRGAVSHPIN